MSENPTIQLHPADNVIVALQDLHPGDDAPGVRVRKPILAGHKIASRDIGDGEVVFKYGAPIGVASKDIEAGQHVHEHNLHTALSNGSGYLPEFQSSPAKEFKPASVIDAFACASGRVAIRNEIWIINTVGCVNQTATRLAERANRQFADRCANLDGFFAFPHPYGCSQLGDDLSMTRQILAGLISHPHAAGVLVIGLGCENNQIEEQIKAVDDEKLDRIVFFNTQNVGDEIQEGLRHLQKLAEVVSSNERVKVPCDRLVIGMKCGGSDGLSGITANPLLGRVADRHAASGGTVLLSEVPEMFGAESVLLSRCASKQVYDETHQMICEFKDYFRRYQQPISENPSPGNRAGGITTLEEKSLGCVQKGGADCLIKQVVPYAGRATPRLGGIALVNSPGNDAVSTTALSTAGANVILFTTGRGTPLGAPVPTLKIATNSTLSLNKPGWIDFDAGRLISEHCEMDELADELYELILRVASGLQAKNEINDYREIAIWKTGVTL